LTLNTFKLAYCKLQNCKVSILCLMFLYHKYINFFTLISLPVCSRRDLERRMSYFTETISYIGKKKRKKKEKKMSFCLSPHCYIFFLSCVK